MSDINSNVHEVVKAAREELHLLMCQHTEVVKRINTLKRALAGLANLFGKQVLSDDLLDLVDRRHSGRQQGLTQLCRQILIEEGRPLNARDLCKQINNRVPPMLLRHKNPLASVATILRRLEDYGMAKTVVQEDGKRTWQAVNDPTGRAP